MQVCSGLPISQGLAAGKIVFLGAQKAAVRQAGSPQEEQLRFESAQRQAVDALGALYEKARAELGEKDAEIFSVHQLMAEDEDFTDLVSEAIADGAEASEAVRQAGEQCAAMFSSMDDAYMRERAADVQDVAARIRRILRGEAETTLTGPCLIAAEELTPSQTVQFPRAFVQGFLTARGAANSHTGILARTLGVPAVSQLPVDAQLQGRTAILNGDEGTLILDPDEDQLRAAEAGIRARQAQREALQQLAKLPSVTKDGHAIRLYANLAGTDDLPLLQQSGAEGVGLLRSEFLYLGRSSYPTEDELFASYRQLVQAMDGREIIIRTLDIGADKKADYFDLPPEDNPALGLRAIRLCLTRPALLQTQLCAILRASVTCGAILAGADSASLEKLGVFGAELGVAFQIADDILDVVSDTATLGKPAGSDEEEDKNTYPALVGLDRSRALARQHADSAIAAIRDLSGGDADFLRGLAVFTVERVK